jgi:Tol biopolymer transport system component/DNA-binding winged helix-turn-helix (wHTH) protein
VQYNRLKMAERVRQVLCFEGFEFDPLELCLRRGDERIVLQPKVGRTLELLLAHAGQVVTKDELMAALWPDSTVFEEALTQLVRKLRKALNDDSHTPRFVETIPKRGYRFVPTVTVLPTVTNRILGFSPQSKEGQGTPAPALALAPALPSAADARARWHRWLLIAAAAALPVVTVLAWLLWRSARPAPPPLDPGRSVVRRLTFDAEHKQEACFAPDGRTVVFAANDPLEGQLDLYLIPIDGSTVVRLTHTPAEEFYPQVSPSGDLISFSRVESYGGQPTIVAIPPLGGAERVLAPGGMWSSWSPNGREIVFAREVSGHGWSLIRRELASGREIPLLPPSGLIQSAAWSPSGAYVAFTDERAVFVVSASGGEPRRLGAIANQIRSVAWETPTTLVCDANWSGRSTIWRVPLDGSPPVALTATSGTVFHPAASRDARKIVYVQEYKSSQLYRVDARGKDAHALPLKATLRCFDLDAAGARLAYTDDEPTLGIGRIGIVSLPSGQPRDFGIEGGGCPVFAPTADALAYVNHEPTGDALVTVALNGAIGQTVSPAEPARSLVRPTWSPTGDALAVAANGGARGSGLYLFDLHGDAGRRLATGAFDSLAWSPDGRFLAACGVGADGPGLYLIAVATGMSRRLNEGRSFAAPPIWAEDSDTILVLRNERTRPRFLRFDLEGREVGEPFELEFSAAPGFWGIFEVRPLGNRGFIYALERYQADLYVLEPPA